MRFVTAGAPARVAPRTREFTKVARRLIRRHMARTLRYELAYMNQAESVGVATGEHEQIIAALEAGRLATACKRLAKNMSSAESPLIAWVRGLETESE